MSKIKNFESFKVNEELHEGEMEISRNVENLPEEDQERYLNFIEEYNELVLRTGLKVSNFHGDSAIYDVYDKNYNKILLVYEYNKGTLRAE